MSTLTIAKTCGCGHNVTLTGDDDRSNLLGRLLDEKFEHWCPQESGVVMKEMTSVKAPPPAYETPGSDVPWPLAQALYYQYYADKPGRAQHWDDLGEEIRAAWAKVAQAAVAIVRRCADPYDYMTQPGGFS